MLNLNKFKCFRNLTTAATTQQQLQQQQQSQHSKIRNSCFNFTKLSKHLKVDRHPYTMLTLVLVVMAIGLCTDTVLGNPTQRQHQHQQQQQHQQTNTVRVQQCREGCLEKFTTKDGLCQQNSACLRCWEECIKSPPAKISKSIRETWSLHTVSMLQQDSLVLVDVAWEPLSLPNQCLVTWEVSGGGLMGNLLTESFNVQLSLWPDTNYRVQVTCKNKLTGLMSRSLPLTIDTSDAVKALDTNLLQIRPTLRKQIINPYITNKPIIRSTSQTPIESVTKKQMPNSFDFNVIPYEDQSAEHTNFIFNWHMRKNSDISSIEPLNKPDLNMLTIAALSDMQKPLMFGMVAGTILLTFILLLYVCMMRQQRLTSDKTSLMGDEVHAQVMSMPPVLPTTTVAAATGTTVLRNCEEICKNSATCSRYALKV